MTSKKANNPRTKNSSVKLPTKTVVFDATNEFEETFKYWDYLVKKVTHDRPLLKAEILFIEAFANEVKGIFESRKEVANV